MTARPLALLAALMLASAGHAAPVPFVGCPADGQTGPVPPPVAGPTRDLPAGAAARLALYRAEGMSVLGPRGWHCFESYGSNGATLLVTPAPLDWGRAAASAGLRGPAIQLSLSNGGTSGRFAVAEIAARAFPAAHGFVARVEAEGLTARPHPRGPFPTDRLTRLGAYRLRFTTPAGRRGLGTISRLAPDTLPIDGAEWLRPDGEMDLTSLAVRLPPALRPLATAIIRQATSPGAN